MSIFSRGDLARTRTLDLATGRSMVRNLLITPTGVWAAYRMGPQAWSFVSPSEQWALIERVATRWAMLAGTPVQELVTSMPYPVGVWAQRLDARTPTPLRDQDGTYGSWNAHLAAQQARIATSGMDDTVVFRFFRVSDLPPRNVDVRTEILNTPDRFAEVENLLEREGQIAEFVAGPGFDGARATEAEMGWLRHRAVAPGVPAPTRPHIPADGWAPDQMGEFCDQVVWEQEQPLDRVIKVTASRGGDDPVVAYAAVLALGRVSKLAYPEAGLEPWMVFGQRARDSSGDSFPVEWSTHGAILPGSLLVKDAEYDLGRAAHLRKNYMEWRGMVPAAVDRAVDLGATILDQVSTGEQVDSVRFVGTVRARVTGATPKVVMGRVRALTALYGAEQLRMALEHPFGQAALLRSFVPGEPRVSTGYQHQFTSRYLAAGMPTVRSRVGDGHGPYQGYTIGATRNAVLRDSHYATECAPRRANLWVWVGDPGSGKSLGIAKGAFETAVRGISTLVNDPSGRMASILDHSALTGHGVHIDLLDSPAGILNPPGLILAPTLAGVGGDPGRLLRAKQLAAQERGNLTCDAARMCLEDDLYGHPATKAALRAARGMVSWSVHASTWDLVDSLHKLGREGDEHARNLGAALEEAAVSPRTYLLFPGRGDATDQHPAIVKTLAIITSKGLRLPDDHTPRADWTHDELAAVPLTHLSTFLAARHAYSKPMQERASLVLDEMKDPLRTSSGRALLSRLGSDSSKWNLEVVIASQNPEDVLKGDTSNYIAGAYVGRIKPLAVAKAALPLLLIEDTSQAARIQHLSEQFPGEFLHRDIDGQVEAIRVDCEHLPELKALLLTDPRPAGAEAWDLERVLA